VRDELVSVEAAANEYGVVIAADGQNADHEATRLLRARLRSHQHSLHPSPDTTARELGRSSSA
jgi:hypothetical protein